MFLNYLFTAFRSMARRRILSLIIVLGLTMGLALFGLILEYVHGEFSHDRFNVHYKNIYRLEFPEWALTGTAYGPEISGEFPEVVSSTRVSCWDGLSVTLKVGDNLMQLSNLVYADTGFFRIFSFHLVRGNPEMALSQPNSILLTESAARKIFGKADPMNKTLLVNNQVNLTVTGVIRDEDRFNMKINALVPFPVLQQFYGDPDFLKHYDSWNYYTYFLLKPNTNARDLSDKINTFYTHRAMFDDRPSFFLRPLSEIYFTHIKNDFPQTRASKPMLRLYLLIAFFILFIACVNFINLSVALASTRSKEIGVRKVLGAKKPTLVFQYLGESILYALIGTELSLVLIELLQPEFNSLVQRQLSLSSIPVGWILFLVIGLPLLVGFLAGIYPALYLTRFKAVVTLKGQKTRGRESLFFRRILIVVQFLVSIVLIIATLTVHRQSTFMQRADLGFNKEQIINMTMNGSLNQHMTAFRQQMEEDPDVRGISLCTQSLDNVTWQNSLQVGNESRQYTYLGIDADFIPFMGIQVKEGRNFQAGMPSDSDKVVINEAAVRYFGLHEPAIGQFIGTGPQRFEVLGVVKDFHYNSLHNPIGPMVMMLHRGWLSTINIRVKGSDLPHSIHHLQSVWDRLCPEFLFDYRFLDQQCAMLYKDDVRLGRLFLYLSALAIVIAGMGLLGLSAFLAEQRTKEIGIRKAMGNHTLGIILLVSGDLTRWILVSGILAVPLGWYFMQKWLHGFAYHIHVNLFILVVPCFLAFMIALATVALQTWRAASANPVNALRYE